MYYSTESQIHINPARRENLSFISDRNLRKGQGTAPLLASTIMLLL